MNGVSINDHLGRTVREVVPQIYEKVKSHLARAIAGESVAGFEVRVCRHGNASSGETLLVSYEPVRDEGGEMIGVSVAIIDITAREEAVEKLRANESRLQAILGESIPHEVISSGPGWGESAFAPSGAHLWGNRFQGLTPLAIDCRPYRG